MKRKIALTFFILLISISMWGLTLKGAKDITYFQRNVDSVMGGPYEGTNSTSRFELIRSLVDYRTVFFNEEQASLSAPDIVYYKGKYFSIFTPGVSFLSIPFYLVGKTLGYPQLITYMATVISALLNLFLVYAISRKMGVNFYISLLAGFLFLFGTNAFPYALTLTQHHMSTTIILLALLNALSRRTFLSNMAFGVLVGIGAMVDIPNLFALLPIGLYIAWKHLGTEMKEKTVRIKLNMSALGLIVGLVPFLGVFAYYNYQLTGSYTMLGQVIGRSDYPAKPVSESQEEEVRGITMPLEARLQLQGIYITIFSDERGILFYNTVTMLGIIGLVFALKSSSHKTSAQLTTATVLMIIASYSMHGDPWGGWSFGSRYAIPISGLMMPMTALALQKLKKNIVFVILFILSAVYGLYISTLGALTTTLIPPKQEAEHLAEYIPYTYERNVQLIEKNFSGSLVYNSLVSELFSAQYYLYFCFVIALVGSGILFISGIVTKEK